MGFRVVFLYSVTFLAWTYVCLVDLWIYGFNVLLSSFGAVSGLVFGSVATQWQLRMIEKNGEFKATRKTWVLALLAVIVFVTPALYFAFSLGFAGVKPTISYVLPVVLALYATQTSLFLIWERKQRKHILSEGFISPRIYASPETQEK